MDYFDQIDEYLNDALSESDKIAFEVAMETDAKLKQAVDDHEVAMDVLGSILEGEIRSLINNEELKINSEGEGIENGGLKIDNVGEVGGDQEGKNEVKVRRMNWMRWGAAAAVVFVLGWWGMSEFGNNDNSKLYAETYSDPTWTMERGDNAGALSKSIVKYFNGAEADAKSELKANQTIEAKYWLAEIYYKEMKFDSTLLFIPMEVADNKNRRDRINYLEILSLYFSGDEVGAKKAFSTLPLDTDSYYDQIYSKLHF